MVLTQEKMILIKQIGSSNRDIFMDELNHICFPSSGRDVFNSFITDTKSLFYYSNENNFKQIWTNYDEEINIFDSTDEEEG